MEPVDLWAIDLARGEDDCNELAGRLAADELARAANMRVPEARRRFIVARACLRLLLARYLGCEPDDVAFVLGRHGKPSVPGSSLSFNLSHSRELGLIAVTHGRAVGVDVEFTRRRRDPLRIARRYFTAAESAAIERDRDPATDFFRHWVVKEALLKATGLGLAAELDSFEIELEPLPRIVRIDGDEDAAKRWSVDLIDLPGSYAGALVTDGWAPRSPLRQFDPARVDVA